MILKVGLYYFQCFLSYLFNFKNKYSLAFEKLCNTSFNVKEIDRYHYKTVISGVLMIYRKKSNDIPKELFGNCVIFDLNEASKNHRINYYKSIHPSSESIHFVSAEKCSGFNSLLHKISFLIITLPIQLSIVLLGLFKKDKSGIAFVLLNLLITCNISVLMAKSGRYEITIFSAYDTNNAFLSFFLQKNQIKVSCVTSEVPLYKWNKIIICNELVLCSDYQYEEVKRFKETIHYDTIRMGEPENFFLVKELYTNTAKINSTIGFLSTGGWVRNALGHIDQGTDIEKNENVILSDLNELLINSPQIHLIIYPHPREISFFNNKMQELKTHYKKHLKDIDFTINNSSKKSNQLFDENYLSVCYMTTLVFERAFAKRKSAIVYYRENDFPLNYKSDYLFFINNKHELSNIIRSTFQLT